LKYTAIFTVRPEKEAEKPFNSFIHKIPTAVLFVMYYNKTTVVSDGNYFWYKCYYTIFLL